MEEPVKDALLKQQCKMMMKILSAKKQWQGAATV